MRYRQEQIQTSVLVNDESHTIQTIYRIPFDSFHSRSIRYHFKSSISCVTEIELISFVFDISIDLLIHHRPPRQPPHQSSHPHRLPSLHHRVDVYRPQLAELFRYPRGIATVKLAVAHDAFSRVLVIYSTRDGKEGGESGIDDRYGEEGIVHRI